MSLFDLKTSEAELSPSNNGQAKMDWVQIPPDRDITDFNFHNGAIHIRWEVSGPQWWVPGRSYVRIRFSLKDHQANAAALTNASGIVPNMLLASNLWQSMEFRINGKVISRCSGNVAQIEALDTRLHKSRGWMDSVGKTTAFTGLGGRGHLIQYMHESETVSGEMLGPHDFLRGFEEGADTAQVTAATSTVTLADANADANNPLRIVGIAVGDTVIINNVVYTVTTINSPLIFKVAPQPGADVGVAAAVLSNMTIYKGSQILSSGVTNYELCWQPSLSIFKVGHALPSGKYELVFNPYTNGQYQKRCIESIRTDRPAKTNAAAVAAGGFEFLVKDFYFYCAQVEGPRVENATYLLDLDEMECEPQQFTGAANTLTQEHFNVSPSSYALTIAFQHKDAETSTLYSATRFRLDDHLEKSLIRMYINYAGTNKPQPDAEPSWNTNANLENYMIQRYFETQVNTGGYFDAGGTESFYEWCARGPYYHFLWPKDATDRSSRVNVYFQFSKAIQNAAGDNIGQIILFHHYKRVARVRIEDGRVIDIQVEDV